VRDRVVSIDIGTCNTKIVEGNAKGSIVTAEKAFMFPTPQNSVDDGRITDFESLRNEIANQLNAHKVTAKKAVFSLESTSVIRRELELPLVKPEDMDSMISFEVEQYLPIVLSNYVIEYKLLEEFTEEEQKKCRISVAALPRVFSEEYLRLAQELKLTPLALDIHSNSVSKLFGAKAQINGEYYSLEKTAAVIDYGHHSANLIIVSKGIPRLNRLIGIGGAEISFNIANTFGLEVKDAQVRKEGLKQLFQAADGYQEESLLDQAAMQSVDNWMNELRKLFQFYTSRSNDNRIDEIYLYGGSSKLGGLVEYLNSNLNLPVYRIEKHGNIRQVKDAAAAELAHFLNAIGAIIRK
jgi:type IV pilus assembly protein PilM